MLRLRLLLGFVGVVVLTAVLGPAGYGQFQFKKGGGGGNPFGAPPGGPSKGFGNPNVFFDRLSGGKDVIVISEAPPTMQQQFAEFALDQGIKNGQITREQFPKYMEFLRNKATKKVVANGGTPAGQELTEIFKVADAEFAQLDANGDGVLNIDEMPPALRNDLPKWDKNKDGMIDLFEYRNFSVTRYQERFGSTEAAAAAIKNNIDPDDELEKRPTVYRAGKLPAKGLPSWFKQLDTDGDGQIALWEWRAAGRDLYDFKEWDRDDDGFITPEEAIHVFAALTKTADPLLASAADSNPTNPGMMPGQGFRGQFPGGLQMQFGKGQFPGGFQMQIPGGFGGGGNPFGGGKGFQGGGNPFGGGKGFQGGGGNPFGGGGNPQWQGGGGNNPGGNPRSTGGGGGRKNWPNPNGGGN